MLNERPARRGFTLIELMIALAISGVLAAAAIPSFLRYQHRSRLAETWTEMASRASGASSSRARAVG